MNSPKDVEETFVEVVPREGPLLELKDTSTAVPAVTSRGPNSKPKGPQVAGVRERKREREREWWWWCVH